MKLLLLIVIGCTLPALAPAIKCYQCLFTNETLIAASLGMSNEEDCKSSNDKYLKECNETSSAIPGGKGNRQSGISPLMDVVNNMFKEDKKRFSCMKGEGTIRNISLLMRGCSNYADNGCKTNNTEANYNTCYCNEDGCNSSNVLSTSNAAIFLTVFYVIIRSGYEAF